MRNDSGRFIPYKPENESGVVKLCNPGQTCDADGVYPPSCSDFPIKIVNGCTGEVRTNGRLWVFCPLLNAGGPGFKGKFPALGQLLTGGRTEGQFHKDHPDWLIPNGEPFCGCELPPAPQVPSPGEGR